MTDANKRIIRSASLFLICLLMIGSCIGVIRDTCAQTADDITFMTEEFPPLNFKENGQIKGIASDLLILMLQNLNSDLSRDDIKLYPWARGYKIVQKTPDTCLFTMGQTIERKNMFKWVGPIVSSANYILIAKKDKKISIKSFDEINNYKTGAVLNDATESILLKKGVKKENLISVTGEDAAGTIIKLLNSNVIDFWAHLDIAAVWTIKKSGFEPGNYEYVFMLQEEGVDGYYAFHKDTSKKLIKKFQSAFDMLKTKGTYQEIFNNYLGKKKQHCPGFNAR